MTAIALAMTIAGGTLELVGLWLVWRDIQRDRERAASLLRSFRQQAQPERRYPHRFSAPGPSLYRGLESHEAQVHRLERSLGKLAAEVGNALIDMRKLLDKSIDGAVEEARTEMNARDSELRSILRDVLAGSIRDRQIGAVLLAVGIAFAATGSVLGTLA